MSEYTYNGLLSYNPSIQRSVYFLRKNYFTVYTHWFCSCIMTGACVFKLLQRLPYKGLRFCARTSLRNVKILLTENSAIYSCHSKPLWFYFYVLQKIFQRVVLVALFCTITMNGEASKRMSMSDSEMKNHFEFDLYKSILNDLFTNWADSHIELQFTHLIWLQNIKAHWNWRSSVNLNRFYFFRFIYGLCYAFIWTGQCRVDRKALVEERGERDQQRTTSWASNSGHRERSCAVCRRTNHEAIGANLNLTKNIWIFSLNSS